MATIDSTDTGKAGEALRQRGWEVEVLKHETDVERFRPKQGGLSGALSKAAAVFGDEMRILDQIERTLNDGNQVLLVRADQEHSAEVARVLRRHGALSIWDFGRWTFVNVGSTEEGEEETGD
ncbi:MAG: hypothetical protein LC739_07465 [Actinobacteria bacterium]|nr:hypothetical protein [Actinomycetota bacterium]